MRAAVEEAALYGAFVAVHAHGAEGAQRAIRAGARSVEHGSMLDRGDDRDARRHGHLPRRGPVRRRVGARARRRRSAGRPTRCARCARRWTRGSRPSAGPSRRGVRITYATDSGVYPHELVARQFDAYVRFGMAPLAAIRSATVDGRRVPGLGGPRRDAGGPGGSRTSSRWTATRSPTSRVLERPVVVHQGRARRASTGARAAGHPARTLTPVLLGIDHLVIAVAIRRRPRRSLERDLGLAVTGGGRHEAMGTYNRLAFLGDTYVELIGVFDRRSCARRRPSPWAARRWRSSRRGARAWRRTRSRRTTSAGDVARLRARRLADRRRRGRVARAARTARSSRWVTRVPRRWARSEPPFLIEHEPRGRRVGRRGSGGRAAFRHPGGGRVRLAALELPVADPERVAASTARCWGSRSARPGARRRSAVHRAAAGAGARRGAGRGTRHASPWTSSASGFAGAPSPRRGRRDPPGRSRGGRAGAASDRLPSAHEQRPRHHPAHAVAAAA